MNIEVNVHKHTAVWPSREYEHPFDQRQAKKPRMDDVAVIIPAIQPAKLRAAMRNTGKRKRNSAHALPLPPGSDQPHPGYYVIRESQCSFDELCQPFNLGYENRRQYRSQLVKSGIPDKMLTPSARPIPKGMAFPKPLTSPALTGSASVKPAQQSCDSGGSHKSIEPMPLGSLHSSGRSQLSGNNTERVEYNKWVIDVEELWVKAGQWVRAGITIRPEQSIENPRVLSAVVRKKRKYKRKTSTGAVGSLHEPPPTTMEKALNHPTRSWEWMKAILDEWNGLEELGVLKHNHTIRDCQEMGITTSPVPLTIVLGHKTGEDGEIERLKCRIAVRGTERHCQPGIHYEPNTFAATPTMTSTRILMAMVILLDLHQKSWDIQKAYVWSELKEGERLIIRYPKGLERHHPQTGEELFMVLHRSLYGLPSAGRQFTQKRDTFMLTEFNKNGWECKRCTMDPCMFHFTKEGKRTWVLCYVDDLDGASECKEHLEEIYQTMNKAWACKEVPSTFMLGIKRIRTEENSIRRMHMTMTAYVEGMYNAFLSYVPKKTVHTPCEPNLLMNLSKEPLNNENRRVLERGYQSAVGMLLWASRGVFPQTMYAVQQLYKMMSKPTEQAWEVVMQVVAWMHQNKDMVGITFRSDRNRYH